VLGLGVAGNKGELSTSRGLLSTTLMAIPDLSTPMAIHLNCSPWFRPGLGHTTVSIPPTFPLMLPDTFTGPYAVALTGTSSTLILAMIASLASASTSRSSDTVLKAELGPLEKAHLMVTCDVTLGRNLAGCTDIDTWSRAHTPE